MELSEHLSCKKKCKCKEIVQDARCKSCKISCLASKHRQCAHCSSYLDRRDKREVKRHRIYRGDRDCRHEERMKYQLVDDSGSECNEEERRNDCDMPSCKNNRCDERRKSWREGKTDPYAQERNMSREMSSDSHNFRKFRCRHRAWRRRRSRRSRSIAMSSSSEESNCGILAASCMKCNSIAKHDCYAAIKGAEKQKRTLNLACKSLNFLERSTYVTKHSYSQCCHENITSCYNRHSCSSRKKHHNHYSSESDEATTRNGRESDCGHQDHGHGCHGHLPSSHCDSYWQMPCNDSLLFSPNGTVATKCQKNIPMRRCILGTTDSPCGGDHVQSQDGCGIEHMHIKAVYKPKEGSSDICEKQNKLWSDCAGVKSYFDAWKIKDQKVQDEWLELSLKPVQRSELKVDGASKNDLKLSLPDNTGELNKEGPVPSGSYDTGVHYYRETIEHVGGNEFPHESSHTYFSVVDPFSLPQTMEVSTPGLSFVQTPPRINLNFPKNIVNMDPGAMASITDGKSVPGVDQNCHFPHTRETKGTVLDQSNLGSSGISEDTQNPVSDHVALPYGRNGVPINLSISEDKQNPVAGHAVLTNGRNGLPVNLSISPQNEERTFLCPPCSQFESIGPDGAADCGSRNAHIVSELLQSGEKKEFSGSVIIVADSEDECFEQSSFDGLHEKNNLVGSSGNIAILKEISDDDDDDDDRQDPLHERKYSSVQDALLARNMNCSNTKDFDLEYRSASLPNVQREGEVENGIDESHKNIDEYAGSMDQLAEDKNRMIEVISSEDESVDNHARNVTIPCKNRTNQESGGNMLGDCDVSRVTDYMILSDGETFSNEGSDNFEVVDSGGEGLLTDVRLHKKLESHPKDEMANAEAVCSSKGVSSTLDPKHLDLQYVEALIKTANSKPRRWDTGILCDLCGLGPSLVYGEWYAWCCGYRLCYCICTEEQKRKLKLVMNQKKHKHSKKWGEHQWSGKVHRMCGLWSSEVFEKDDGKDQLEGLFSAVKRGRDLDCRDPECRRFGATLGCRVRNCRRSFHYPCAVKLASQLRCRIWEGCRRPVACHLHGHVDHVCVSAKERKPQWNYGNRLVNPREGNRNTAIHSEAHQSNDNIWVNQNYDGNGLERDGMTLGRVVRGANLQYLGQNLICEDLSYGMEAIKIPCTNDIDDAPVPSLEYITSSKFSRDADVILKIVLANVKKLAKPCSGCYEIDMDDPKAHISVHVDANGEGRDQDRRIDWQGEPMLGRLPYDRYGLLQLGWLTIDVVECNSKCLCGNKCVNRELQKGLQLALEVFKTEDRGWGVRTLEQIPRGKFVMEFVGEVLTQREASKQGKLYAEYSSSYLCNLDHPAVAQEDHLVLDGFKMSNVARFINHSCEGNLRIYRVYTETLDQRVFRIGLYSCRDIEIGEELTYDYKYILEESPLVSTDELSTVKCFCRAKNCRQVLSSGGN